ncbi:MAG TPA: glutathione peroxidase [Treponemataceae bacterium]|nr:glutathione peroxidase [Treponemataceae bacterium]
MSIYEYSATKVNGEKVALESFRGKVLLIVNTATKCGFAPQFTGLEELHKKYGEKGLVVLGFPCSQFAGQELDDNAEILNVCKINFGVTFQIFNKIDVNGKTADPLFSFLRKKTGGLLGNSIKWNFTKFLIDREGNVLKRFAPAVTPDKIEGDIIKLLEQR